MTAPPTTNELEFYYHGFFRILRRYRAATVTGWIIVFAGVAGIPLGWKSGSTHGLLDLLLCAGTIVGGLVLVSEAVSFLGAYTAVPFPSSGEAEDALQGDDLLVEIRRLMKDVEAGGWQEAYAAIGVLQRLGVRHGLPPPG
jgi:hypothetical protein